MTTLPIQDWEALQQQYPKPAMLKMVLQSFIKNHAESPTTLRTLLNTEQFEALGAYAHKLKGAAGIMRARQPAELAAEIEQQAQQTGRVSPELVSRFADLLGHWLSEISTKLDTLTT